MALDLQHVRQDAAKGARLVGGVHWAVIVVMKSKCRCVAGAGEHFDCRTVKLLPIKCIGMILRGCAADHMNF